MTEQEPNQEIININIDVIRNLRKQGYILEANEMIKAWQESIKKNFKEGKKLIKKETNKINRHKKKIKEKKNEQKTD